MDLSVRYQPAESDTGLFGGNSNWRGPIWFPVNFLIIESLQKFHHYYGDDFKVECPTGSSCFLTLNEVANEIAMRLTRIFLADRGCSVVGIRLRGLCAWHQPVRGRRHDVVPRVRDRRLM
jgi:hypothetical protein